MAARDPPQGAAPLFQAARRGPPTDLGAPPGARDRLPGRLLLLGPRRPRQVRLHRGRAPGDPGRLREAGHPAPRAGRARWRRRGRGDGLGERRDHVQEGAGRAGHHLLLVQRGRPGAPRPRPRQHGQGGALHRQPVRGAQLGRVLGRQLLLHPQGRPLPDGALDLLPHQRGQHGPVRADADRVRGRRLRELHGGLHGPDARGVPAPRGHRRDHRRRRRRGQVLDGPELVPRLGRGPGRRLQLCHEAGLVFGQETAR